MAASPTLALVLLPPLIFSTPEAFLLALLRVPVLGFGGLSLSFPLLLLDTGDDEEEDIPPLAPNIPPSTPLLTAS